MTYQKRIEKKKVMNIKKLKEQFQEKEKDRETNDIYNILIFLLQN